MPAVTLLVNPAAGKGRSTRLLSQVVAVLQGQGRRVEVQVSRDVEDARRIAVETVRRGIGVLAVLGGDGMVQLAVQACAAPDNQCTTLGLIPGGTGNDLCRGIGLDPADPLAAAAVIGSGSTTRIDLARVGERWVSTVVATGFDVAVNRRANVLRWPRGQARYLVATLAELSVFSPLHYRLTVDGDVRTLDAMLVAVGNTACYGGGLRICPEADPADGQLDVTIIHPVPRWKLLQLLPGLRSGRFVRDRCVEQFRATRIVVDGPGLVGHGDGEVIGPTPLDVRVAPAAISVFTPQSVGTVADAG